MKIIQLPRYVYIQTIRNIHKCVLCLRWLWVYYTTWNPKTFKNVRRLLGSIPNINNGGCAIAAYIMWCWLDKNKMLQPSDGILYLYKSKSKKWEDVNLSITTGSQVKDSCNHAVIYTSGLYYDSKYVYETPDIWYMGGTYIFFNNDTVNLIIESLYDKNIWNPLFNIKHINMIVKKLELETYIHKKRSK